MDFGFTPTTIFDDVHGRFQDAKLDAKNSALDSANEKLVLANAPINSANAKLGDLAFLPIDLRELAANAFGYSALRSYQTPAAAAQQSNGGQYGAATAASAATSGPKNMFGLPTFVQVNFLAVAGTANSMAFYGLTLLDPLVTVNRPATVIKTAIQGRNGTVKEYIGQGDLSVVIRGIVATSISAADRFAYPLPDVRALQQLVGLGAAIPVSGFLQDVFDIHNLVIENVRYEALPGFVNLQAYEIEAVSDDPIELAL